MKETILRMFDDITVRGEWNLLAAVFVAALVAYFIQSHIDVVNSDYDAIHDTINNEDHPNQNDLQELTTFRRFQKEQPEFQCAVLDKLKAHNIVPTAIEKTMSPEQLYKTHNLLWMTGFSVEAIEIVFILEDKWGRDIVANECIDEFMSDYKNGMKPVAALEKQLQKMIAREE